MIFKRPWQVYPFLLILLVFTISMWARVGNGAQLFDYLGELPLSVSPWYLVITGAVWGIAGLAVLAITWWGKPRPAVIVTAVAVLYSLNFWVEQLVLMVSPLRKVNWPFLIVINLFLVLFTTLTFKQPAVSTFYGGRYEQEIQP